VEEGGPGPVLRTPFGELGENTKIIIIIYPKEIKYSHLDNINRKINKEACRWCNSNA